MLQGKSGESVGKVYRNRGIFNLEVGRWLRYRRRERVEMWKMQTRLLL
jgi:hypothetical protein